MDKILLRKENRWRKSQGNKKNDPMKCVFCIFASPAGVTMYDNSCSDAKKPLYTGCTNFMRLSMVLRLFNLKTKSGWTNKSFTELHKLLKDMLTEGNTLSNRNYEAENYSKEGNHSTKRKMSSDINQRVLWYLPIISRFKRLFAKSNNAKNLR
ncbi:hypothetical protein CR513_39182, partial [Mucuna pruriens]